MPVTFESFESSMDLSDQAHYHTWALMIPRSIAKISGIGRGKKRIASGGIERETEEVKRKAWKGRRNKERNGQKKVYATKIKM